MNKLVSFVVPVYFEEECIEQFIFEVNLNIASLSYDFEFVFIDDGSKDDTVKLIKKHASKDKRIKLIEFSYNQGKQAAVSAGIAFATGDYLLYMDPDLQDPPEEICNFLSKIEEGYDIVYGIRKEKVDTFLNKIFSKLFWGTLRKYTGLAIPKGLAVMRLFNRQFADKFLQYNEQNRFIEGIFFHIGQNSTNLEITQRKRFAGTSKFNFKKKMKLALDAIFDFSELPLKLAVKTGIIFSLLGFTSLLIILILKLFIDFAAGWPSIISAIIFSLGLNLFFIGIAAIYIGKIYKETKKRPLYSIKDTFNIDNQN
jgi:polyisoprenyl-phosphate glycosyltransferase